MPRTYSGRTLTGQDIALTIDGNKILSVTPATLSDPPLIAPPLVDLQHNGALGHRYNNLHNEPDGLKRAAKLLRRHGVGRVLFTTTTCPFDFLLDTLKDFDRQLKSDPDLARLYVGHFNEGIYISSEKGWGGAHDLSHIRNPSWDQWQQIRDASGNRTRIFNIDPTMDNAIATIEQATRRGLRVALGHCNPDAETVKRAADAGATLVTHFGNGIPAQIHRHNNPLWSYLADDRLILTLIADGHHLPADVLRTAFATKGNTGAYITSDASPFSGLPPGEYDNRAIVTPDGACRQKSQPELLAGAWFQLDRGVERLCQLGWTLPDAWRQASTIPASVLNIDLPDLVPGAPADFVLARFANDRLTLEQVVDQGVELLASPITPLDAL